MVSSPARRTTLPVRAGLGNARTLTSSRSTTTQPRSPTAGHYPSLSTASHTRSLGSGARARLYWSCGWTACCAGRRPGQTLPPYTRQGKANSRFCRRATRPTSTAKWRWSACSTARCRRARRGRCRSDRGSCSGRGGGCCISMRAEVKLYIIKIFQRYLMPLKQF